MSFGAFYTDENWTREFRLGKEEAFEFIYRQMHDRLYAFALRFLKDPAEAQDIIADSFLKLWQQKLQFSDYKSVSVFLFLSVKHKCLDVLKHEGVKHRHHAALLETLSATFEDDFTVELVRLEFIQKIYKEVDRLPEKMKQVFLLSYQDGLKPADIATQLNLSVQTVKNQRIKAIRKLKDAFANDPKIWLLLCLMETQHVYLS
ncbi:MAG: RNA polymerase sigma-70 factor [Chitinophagaceae bacterium]|nr:RNA polymerase sigma-70 factor [Chitinophagaceae bacterium]